MLDVQGSRISLYLFMNAFSFCRVQCTLCALNPAGGYRPAKQKGLVQG